MSPAPVSADKLFVEWATEILTQQSQRIQVCLDKLDDSQIWARGGEHENAIGNLVLHLCGNVRQWIGTGVGGKLDIRVRDREFSARGGVQRADLKERLTTTVADALAVIGALDATALTRLTEVQGYTLPLLKVVGQVVHHFASHTGQIILLTKHATGEDLGFYRHLAQPKHGERVP